MLKNVELPRSFFTLSFLSIMLFAACSPNLDVQNDPLHNQASPVPRIELPTEEVLPPDHSNSDSDPTVTPDPTGTEEEPAQIPSGLTYENDNTLWRINEEGIAVPLQNLIGFEFLLSPDGKHLLYAFENDYWLLDLETGESQNITNTPEDWEKWAIWWPSYPNLIVMCHGNYSHCGNLLVLDLDDLSQHILEKEGRFWCRPAPSPDGENLLLDSETLYNWKTGDTSNFGFEMDDYGFDGARSNCAAWSPKENQIAWRAVFEFQEQNIPECEAEFETTKCGEDGVVILDFEEETVSIIDVQLFPLDAPYGTAFHPTWSPDGEWITLYHYARTDSWEIVASDGSFNSGFRGRVDLVPIFSQDGQWIAYMGTNRLLYVAEVGVWEPIQVGPQSSQLVGWIE